MLKAILIDCIPPSLNKEEADFRMQEAESLIKTYGGIVLIKKIQKKIIPNYSTYIGSGKVEEIIEENKTLKANILIVNNELKPQQTYNLSEKLRLHNLEVWDRLDLILKIFQKHATTKEARLEIELASIRHMGPRIFGMGMQLSRQGGGIGTKGVGETNIEFMKRHLAKLEQRIKKELEDCKHVRALHRAGRKRRNLQTVGIIGYTNAGKTSLLNALTRKGAVAANKLFTTLDTRVGKMYIPQRNADNSLKEISYPKPNENLYLRAQPHEILISDTIGFIQDLPTTLIKSFASTLEETIEADLLLHVIDISDPKMIDKIQVVNEILTQINVLHKPTIYVFNKTDLKPKSQLTKIQKSLQKEFKEFKPQFISTCPNTGIEELKKMIATNLSIP